MTTAPSPPPVVLLHGFGGSTARTWGPAGWLELLADVGRRVVGIDLLGHGEAPKPHDPAAYAALEDHARDALPDEVCDGVAFSLGARVALTLAAREPHRFRRLVVAGVGANLVESRPDGELAALLAVTSETFDDLAASPVARYFQGLLSAPDADADALVALANRPAQGPLTPDDLGRVTCPVLVVLGDRDFAGPAAPLVDALPDARLVTLPGVDHFSTPKHFGFLDATLEFLAEGVSG